MSFSEYRTLAERAGAGDATPRDDFQENNEERPGWVRKYLDLADLAIQRGLPEDEEKKKDSNDEAA